MVCPYNVGIGPFGIELLTAGTLKLKYQDTMHCDHALSVVHRIRGKLFSYTALKTGLCDGDGVCSL